MSTQRDALRERLDRATAHLDPPFAAVDLAAFDANSAALADRAAGKPVRIASKSIWLVRTGAAGDAPVAYPTADRNALADLAADAGLAAAVTLMVDDPAQLDLVDAVAAPDGRAPVRVCLDLDASWQPLGGRVHIAMEVAPAAWPRPAPTRP